MSREMTHLTPVIDRIRSAAEKLGQPGGADSFDDCAGRDRVRHGPKTIPKQIGYGKRENAFGRCPGRLGGKIHRMPKTTKIRPEDVAAISARLRHLRATTGLSQEQFATQAKLGYKQWGNFESELGRIGIDAAVALVRAHRVTLDWIYLGDRSRMPGDLLAAIDAAEAAATPPAAAASERKTKVK